MKTRRDDVATQSKRRKLQAEQAIPSPAPPVRPEAVVSFDLPFPFNTLSNELIEFILEDANRYDFSMLGGTCWTFHEYIARNHPLERAPRAILDYSCLKDTYSPSYAYFSDQIKVLPNGDSVHISKYNDLLYLHFGSCAWMPLVEEYNTQYKSTDFFLVAGKYLIVNKRSGVSVWCVRDTNEEIQRQKLQFFPHPTETSSPTINIYLRKNNDIVVIQGIHILQVLKFNSHELLPFSIGEPEIIPSQRFAPSATLLFQYGLQQNLVCYEFRDRYYLWDLETNQLQEWLETTVRQRVQNVLPADEIILDIELDFTLKTPSGFFVIEATIIDAPSRYYLINFSSSSPPLFLWRGTIDDLNCSYKLTSHSDIVLVGKDIDDWNIFSEWDCNQNIFQSAYSPHNWHDNFYPTAIDFSEEGNILFRAYKRDTFSSTVLVVWKHQTKELIDVAIRKWTPAQYVYSRILPSGDIVHHQPLNCYRILDGQTGHIKTSLRFGTRWNIDRDSTMLYLLPSGDIQINWGLIKQNRTHPENTYTSCHSKIYRFGIWRQPEEKTVQDTHDHEMQGISIKQ